MRQQLPPDATFVHLRLPPMKIAGLLLSVQSQMGKVHEEAMVRLSLAGASNLPVYRLEQLHGKPLLTIVGSRGKPLVEDAAAANDRKWSTATMTYNEVVDTMMELAWAELDRLQNRGPGDATESGS